MNTIIEESTSFPYYILKLRRYIPIYKIIYGNFRRDKVILYSKMIDEQEEKIDKLKDELNRLKAEICFQKKRLNIMIKKHSSKTSQDKNRYLSVYPNFN